MHVLRNPLFAHSNANALKVKYVGASLARHGYKVKKVVLHSSSVFGKKRWCFSGHEHFG